MATMEERERILDVIHTLQRWMEGRAFGTVDAIDFRIFATAIKVCINDPDADPLEVIQKEYLHAKSRNLKT